MPHSQVYSCIFATYALLKYLRPDSSDAGVGMGKGTLGMTCTNLTKILGKGVQEQKLAIQ